jgi:hypothetical protein
MNTTTIATTFATNASAATLFDEATNEVYEQVLRMYTHDEENQTVELSEDQLQAAHATSEAARNAAAQAFAPLLEASEAQEAQIEALEAELAQLQKGSKQQLVKAVKKNGEQRLAAVVVPTADWLARNQTSPLKNVYNLYCKVYAEVHGHFPGAGVWKDMSAEEKQPWIDAAKAHNARLAASAGPGVAAPVAVANPFAQMPNITPQMAQALLMMLQGSQAQVQAPVQAEKAKKSTAGKTTGYRLWLSAFLKQPENKGKSYAESGTWNKVPAEIKAHYEAQAKAINAARA